MKFEQINTENKTEYWEIIDKEFGLPAELVSNYLKQNGQDKTAAEIIQDWQQELMDWRANNGIGPIQNLEKDVFDLKELLTKKAENELLSEEATADSCYYNHLLLLSLGTSEIQKNPKLRYKKDEDVDQEELLDVRIHYGQKIDFYKQAKEYLYNRPEYNKNKTKNRYNLERNDLDSDALVVLNKLGVLDYFYTARDYYHFKTLPSFVADKMLENKKKSDLYYTLIFRKFESFSNLVAQDIFNNGADDVESIFLKDFDRFPQTDPLWALDKVLKCSHDVSGGLVLNFIDKYLKRSEDIKTAYKMILSFGISVGDREISNDLSEEDRQEYKETRDKFISDISVVLGDHENHPNHNSIEDSEKFYEMADNGYGPVLLSRTRNCNVNFDRELLIEKLQKNKQSFYCLHNYDLQHAINASSLIEDIINEGDIDVLAANTGRLDSIRYYTENFIKLWKNGYDRAVKKNIRRFSCLPDEVLQLLIDSDEVDLVLSNLSRFNLSPGSLKGLIDNFGDKFADYSDISLGYLQHEGVFDYFLEKVNDAESLKKLLDRGFLDLTAENKNRFVETISKTDFFNDFLTYALRDNYLPNLDFKISAEDFNKVIEKNGQGGKIILFIENIKNKPQDSFYVQNIEFFTNNDNQALISFFIRLLNEKILSHSQEDLNLLLATDKRLALKIIESGNIYLLVNNLGIFKDLDQEIAAKLVEARAVSPLINNLEKFRNLSRDFGQELISSLKEFSGIAEVNEYFTPPLDKMVAKTSEIFGAFANADNYNIIKGIDGNNEEIIKKLKLKKGGNDGLRELQEGFVNFKKEIISEKFNPEILLQEDTASLYLPYFQAYVRYQEATWGEKDNDNFKNTVSNYINYKNKKELKKLNSNFTPSQELLIAKSDASARESHQFNEHFLNRFSVLINSIKTAKNLYQEKFPLSKLVEEIEEKRLELIKELKEKADKMPNPRAKEGLDQKINSLESLNIRDVKDFQNNFSILASNKEFNELLRQAVFLISFSKNKPSLDFNLDAVDLEKPEIGDISWTLNFVDHITNQETMSKYFTDKKSKKMFDEIVSAQAISEEMALLQNMGGQSRDVSKIQLVPTRGLLTEFSGHVADACWASKYSSILKEFPNFTPVIIRQNPETKHERLAGAFMLIETESKNGEPLLVVRGFNPIENLINSLSVKDFYDKAIGYVKNLAQKEKRKVAIVIDDHSGGAASNRPVLFEYLSKLSKTLEAIDLKSEDDTSFNGYNIVRKAYLVN